MTDSPIWQQLQARWDLGYDQLRPTEQQTIALWWLQAETMNGTLDQYFWNSAGDQALFARAALVRLAMPVSLQALDSALAHFGATYPTDREQRMQQLQALEDAHGEHVFDAPSRTLQDMAEDYVQAALNALGGEYAAQPV